jgi:AraC-like DNA-binding protein
MPKPNKSLLWLRRNRRYLNISEIAKDIGYANHSYLHYIVTGETRSDGIMPKLTTEKETKLNNLVKEIRK